MQENQTWENLPDQRTDEPEILARTSAAPGKTQTINFYNVNEAIYLVDLPGYGYAKASEEIKAKWGKMIEDYLHKSRDPLCISAGGYPPRTGKQR